MQTQFLAIAAVTLIGAANVFAQQQTPDGKTVPAAVALPGPALAEPVKPVVNIVVISPEDIQRQNRLAALALLLSLRDLY